VRGVMMGARLLCWFLGHPLAEMERLPLDHSSRYRCLRCIRQWVRHDLYGWFRWNEEFEVKIPQRSVGRHGPESTSSVSVLRNR